MLLFLRDLGPFLQAIFKILDTFSGPKVNWDKLTILPLDSGTKAAAYAALPLQRVTHFACLGVCTSTRIVEYPGLNLLPLLDLLKRKAKVWRNLPLLLGHIKLLPGTWPLWFIHMGKLTSQDRSLATPGALGAGGSCPP